MQKPISAILLGSYCLLLGLFFFCVGIEGFVKNNSVFTSGDFGLWMGVIWPFILVVLCLFIGIGMFRLSNKCWKALFFILLFCIGTFSSFIVGALLLLIISNITNYAFLDFLNINTIMWVPLLFWFLSEIIILYYLTREEVRTHFGE